MDWRCGFIFIKSMSGFFSSIGRGISNVTGAVGYVAGGAVRGVSYAAGSGIGLINSRAGQAVKSVGKYAGNAVNAGCIAVGGVARAPYDILGSGCQALEKGGGMGTMYGNFIGGVGSKMSGSLMSAVAAAGGWSVSDVQKVVEAMEIDMEEKVTDFLEKKFKKKGKKIIKKQLKKIVKKCLRKILKKFVMKGICKKVPVAGIAAGAVFALEKGCKMDWKGASMEFASGLVSVVPVAGTGASVAIDVGLLAHEVETECEFELQYCY